MNGITVLVSLAVVGVDYGWQPLTDGQLEYIVQIEPGLLDALKSGEEIVSEILPEARGVRRFRIRVGTGKVPRIGGMQGNTTPRGFSSGDSPGSSRGTGGGRESPVLPPRAGAGFSSGTTTGSGTSGDEFRPDGFLNLPPPPQLLGPDGKNSVLVQPGGISRTPAGTGAQTKEVLPPEVAENETETSSPGASAENPAPWGRSDTTPSDPVMPEERTDTFGTGPSPPGTGVYPPSSGGGPGGWGNSNDMVLPPGTENSSPGTGAGELLPPERQPARPVPGPSSDSQSPNPIPFGRSGIKPPAADATAIHGPTPPLSAAGGVEEAAGTNGAGPGSAGQLQANARPAETLGDPDAAALKPTMDEETAKELHPPKPWTPLVLTSLALFASLAANAYLGWIAVGIHRRYRDVVSQLRQAQASAA